MVPSIPFLLLLALVTPAAAAPFPVGTWFGQGQPHDRGEMWVAQMLADGRFRVQFRSCRKGKATDQFETGRWVLKDDLETIDIATVNGRPMPRTDRYRILGQDGRVQSYRYLRTGFVFTSRRVADGYRMPRCDLVS
ncbi:MAG TPA: hypothetical protein VFS01_05085 [Rhizomicrobium sp.]|jgi:hypothetical protein|nr:hypothetical protein [Rhizomicrobium sp.]